MKIETQARTAIGMLVLSALSFKGARASFDIRHPECEEIPLEQAGYCANDERGTRGAPPCYCPESASESAERIRLRTSNVLAEEILGYGLNVSEIGRPDDLYEGLDSSAVVYAVGFDGRPSPTLVEYWLHQGMAEVAQLALETIGPDLRNPRLIIKGGRFYVSGNPVCGPDTGSAERSLKPISPETRVSPKSITQPSESAEDSNSLCPGRYCPAG